MTTYIFSREVQVGTIHASKARERWNYNTTGLLQFSSSLKCPYWTNTSLAGGLAHRDRKSALGGVVSSFGGVVFQIDALDTALAIERHGDKVFIAQRQV
jgi:hypothetical protein